MRESWNETQYNLGATVDYAKTTSSYGSPTARYTTLRLTYALLRDTTYEGGSPRHYSSYARYVGAGGELIFC